MYKFLLKQIYLAPLKNRITQKSNFVSPITHLYVSAFYLFFNYQKADNMRWKKRIKLPLLHLWGMLKTHKILYSDKKRFINLLYKYYLVSLEKAL